MTSSNLCILAQGIGSGNFSGCDKCLYKSLPRSNPNFKFCGSLTIPLNCSLTSSFLWKWQCRPGNNRKLSVGERTEAWEYPQTTFYTKPCLTAKEDPPHFSLHLRHLTSGLSQLSGSIYRPSSSDLQHRASCQQDLESKLDWYLQYFVKT